VQKQIPITKQNQNKLLNCHLNFTTTAGEQYVGFPGPLVLLSVTQSVDIDWPLYGKNHDRRQETAPAISVLP